MIRKIIFALFTLWAFSPPTPHIYYVDSGSGSDSNTSTQAQSKSTPWAHLPCMANASSNAAAYTPVAGDTFILKGGSAYTNASFPCQWTWSGTSVAHITVGVDNTWFTGGSWNRPIWNAGGTDIGSSCGGLGANWFLYLNGVTYVDFNWIEAKGLYWNDDQQGACFRTVGFAVGNASDFITLNNWYMHGWTHGTSAGTTDTGSGGMIASYNTTPDCGNCIVENSVMDNSDSVDGASCATGGSLCSGGGISSWSSINNIFFDVVEALDTSNYVSTDVTTIAGNNISNIQASFTTPSQGIKAPHPNCIETLFGGSTYYIHDNYIHNTFTCEAMQVGNPGETDYAWNNVLDMGVTGVAGNNGPQVPQSPSGSKSLFFWNNTVRWASGCMIAGGHSTTYTGSFVVQDNHCINDSKTVVGGTTPAGATVSPNVGMTNAIATAQGYTTLQTYVFSPTLFNNSTVGSGTNLTTAFATAGIASTNDTSYACSEQTISGVVQSACPSRTSNTRSTTWTWDVGAYSFQPPSPPVFPSAFNVAPCQVSTDVGNCDGIPVTLPYSQIFIPSTATSTQSLPAAGVPFYEPDYPTLTPYSSPCGFVSFVCGERLFDTNTWSVGLAGLPGGNPCPGSGTFTGVPASNTPSGSDVLVFSKISNGNYTVLSITDPGSSCTILQDVNVATGAITNLRVPSGITGADAEIHADYNLPGIWYGCKTNNDCYQVQELNSVTMAVTQLVDLSNPAIANLPLSVTDPGVIGGAGWVTSSANSNILTGQLGPQNNALLAVAVDVAIPCAIWWRVDTGDMGGGSCWPGGPPTCTGCGIIAPLNNTVTFTGVGVTGNGTTATGTAATTPLFKTGAQHVSIQGCALFNGRELSGVVVSGNTVTWNSTAVGTATGCTMGQQSGLHGDNECQDSTHSFWALNGVGTIVWDQGTLTTWHAASMDGQGHRTCGFTTAVSGPSSSSANFWLLLNSAVTGSTTVPGAGKLANNLDGHYFWSANLTDNNLMYAMNYCLNQTGCPAANPNCPGCGEVTAVNPQAGGLTYPIFQTRKNACANGATCAQAYFYDEVSGQCSADGVLCMFSTNWASTSTGLPTLGSVTQGSLTVYRNDIVMVFMPQSAGGIAPPTVRSSTIF